MRRALQWVPQVNPLQDFLGNLIAISYNRIHQLVRQRVMKQFC